MSRDDQKTKFNPSLIIVLMIVVYFAQLAELWIEGRPLWFYALMGGVFLPLSTVLLIHLQRAHRDKTDK